MITISGHSDDIVYVKNDNNGKEEEYYVHDGGPYKGYIDVGGKVKVHIILENGCWSFAMGQIDDDIEIPDHWGHAWGVNKNGYSTDMMISIPCCDKVRVLFIKVGEEE